MLTLLSSTLSKLTIQVCVWLIVRFFPVLLLVRLNVQFVSFNAVPLNFSISILLRIFRCLRLLWIYQGQLLMLTASERLRQGTGAASKRQKSEEPKEGMAVEPKPNAKPAARRAQRPRDGQGGGVGDSAMPAASVGRDLTSSEMQKEVKALRKELTLTKKCTLITHDAVREIQGGLGYMCAMADKTNPLMVEVCSEGADYNKLQMTLKEEAGEKEDFTELQKLGPASAHVLLRVMKYLTQSIEVKPEEEEASKHAELVKSMYEELKTKETKFVAAQAGTFLIRRTQRKTKLIMHTNLQASHNTALLFMLRRAGCTLYEGKPPRDGPHRALQGTMPQRDPQ